MLVEDVLADLWERADAADSDAVVLGTDDLMDWPAGVFEALSGVGILRESELAMSVACEACESGHWSEVVLPLPGRGNPELAYYSCPESGRQEIARSRLRQWQISIPGIAAVIAREASTQTTPHEDVQGSLWSLGRITTSEGRCASYLMRSAGQRTECPPELLAVLAGHSIPPVVFTFSRLAVPSPPASCRFVPLADIAGWGDLSLRLDLRSVVVGQSNGAGNGLEPHALSGGRPALPAAIWSGLGKANQLIVEWYPAKSEDICRRLKCRGIEWDSRTVDAARSRVRAQLKRQGYGAALPDARPASSGRSRPHVT